MSGQKFDKSSKWLVQHQGKGVLSLGGVSDIRRCRALQAEIVQPRQLPDGLLEVFFRGQAKADYVLVEVATYPEKRALRQAFDDLTLAYQQLKVVPELLMLVLRPRGRFRVSGQHELRSRLGWSQLGCGWKVVELWTLQAEELLADPDVGVVPWVPLTQFDGSPETLLERCRERIEQHAHADDRASLLAVSQVLAQLKFPSPELLALLGGKEVMIESPLIEELQADSLREVLGELLKRRFNAVPADINRQLQAIRRQKLLQKLILLAAECADLEAFRNSLPT